MCSIIGSFSIEKLVELVKLNQFRGNFSYSISKFLINPGVIKDMVKDFGDFDTRVLPKQEDGYYYIAHVQAPTGGLVRDITRIHPSINSEEFPRTFLWHNGIIKDTCIREIQDRYDLRDAKWDWDTRLLHKAIDEEGVEGLSDIDGSFGCIWICEPVAYVFTNDIIRLFIDDDLNLSSVPFDNSKRLPPNIAYMFDFEHRSLTRITEFKSKSSPYFYFTPEGE